MAILLVSRAFGDELCRHQNARCSDSGGIQVSTFLMNSVPKWHIRNIIHNIDPKTGTGKNSADGKIDLPQTGMSGVHKTVAGLAALMCIAGIGLVKKGKKEDKE